MVRITAAAGIAAAAMVLGIGAASAQADNPFGAPVENFFTLRPGGSQSPPPEVFGGKRCPQIVPIVGSDKVWWGRFSGGRIIDGTNRHQRMQNFTSDACFPTQAACEGWMYALKSRYQDNPRFNDCRAGYKPGAPVRWVFGSSWQAN